MAAAGRDNLVPLLLYSLLLLVLLLVKMALRKVVLDLILHVKLLLLLLLSRSCTLWIGRCHTCYYASC